MATVERNGGATPDPFRKLIHEAGLQGMERSGFIGPMSELLNNCHARGLGLAIGFPTFNNQFRGVMYALPLTDNGTPDIKDKVLLIAPGDTECRFAVLGPKKSGAYTTILKNKEETKYARDFHALFSPSKEPLLLSGWESPGDDLFVEFIKDPVILGTTATIQAVLPRDKADAFLERALEIAETIAQRNAEKESVRQRAKSVSVIEDSLSEVIGELLAGDLAFINKEFDREERKRNMQVDEGNELLEGVEADMATDRIKERLAKETLAAQAAQHRELLADLEIEMLRDAKEQGPDNDNL